MASIPGDLKSNRETKNTNMKSLLILTIILIAISCTQNKTERKSTEQQEPISQALTDITSNENMEEWKYLLDSRWYILLKDSVNGQNKYIEPACLSTSGFIEFLGKDTLDKLIIGCGQDVSEFNIRSIEKDKLNLEINYGSNQKIKISSAKSSKKYINRQIRIQVENIDNLLFGYYSESLLELNRKEAIYIADGEELFNNLQGLGLYSKLPCDQEEEENNY